EASSIRKVGDTYYFVYSTFNQHELAYATSDRPDGGFQFGGVIISNGDIGYKGRKPEDRVMRTGNNHGSIEFINGEWYVFYHRHTNKNEYSRQACAEKIEMLSDGTIPQVEITSCGLNGGPLNGHGTYPAVICCALTNGRLPHGKCDGVPYIVCKDGERILSGITSGDIIGYKYFDLTSTTRIGALVRIDGASCDSHLEIMNDMEGTVIGAINLTDCAEWTLCFTDIKHIDGKAPVYFKFYGSGELEIKEIYLG
ncbi:MAG: hypothetical protein IKC74_03950, partial [Clostridia bacterium]|nr:hypothetical protein [Clostridia bacterium]